jgi:NADPH-dependent curcumin reductase CurA
LFYSIVAATMHPNKTLIYKRYAVGWPVPGEHLTVESRPFDPEAPPPSGGITVKNLYLSFDPYQRGQMRLPDEPATYSLPWTEGEPAIVTTLSTVLKSDNPGFKPGDLVSAMADAGEYARVPAELAALTRAYPPLPPNVNIPAPALIGALGIAGLSAYVSFNEFIKEPRAGKTLFVSAASGGVGQVVGQLGKIHGMKVIGSTGSQEKVDFVVNELGFDGAWNYKAEKTHDALKRLAPGGIDVYYDNVGGEQLEVALKHMKDFGQIVVSGMISIYNDYEEERYGVRTLMEIVFRRLQINGFICNDPHFEKYLPSFGVDMVTWMAQGRIKTKENVIAGMDNAPEALIKMWKGDKFGKMVLKIDDE